MWLIFHRSDWVKGVGGAGRINVVGRRDTRPVTDIINAKRLQQEFDFLT